MTHRIRAPHVAALVATLLLAIPVTRSRSWDSAGGNPLRSTHTLLTNWGIDQAKAQYPFLDTYRKQLVDGANTELHELKLKGNPVMYGLNLNEKRVEHKGTNAGCDDIAGWWSESLQAYKSGNKERAYFLLGVILHMVEDMGVPAHANGIYHQGTITEFDNFEAMAALNWKPSFASINRTDPRLADPSKYYAFSKAWTSADAPDYKDRNQFSKTWTFASQKERDLLSNRQGRTATAVRWTLECAERIFETL